MKLLRHGVGSLVIFSLLVLAFVSVYDGFDDTYSFVDKQNQSITNISVYNLTDGNILQQFKEMNLIEGINGIQEGIVKLTAGDTPFDVLGGLSASAIGFAKIFAGLLTAPFTILTIIVSYYGGSIIPSYAIAGISTLIAVYIFFILLSAYLRSDL